ncbi:putative lipopolysaccharide biosynthesis protein [Yersinia aldovae]|uniref:Lipopolysaccharide biosynthesis protein n=1 Tax=Yersinia aldovae TaxID=29483 RepID=A0A0T9UIL0_YERAL|nr:O-antigen translocase [Yersinia aldovae]CNL44138.1 putative lipopolysaccharide biosynthesis protein [Yersinia aldovae]CNL78196.1 putative lipopolysaccharide biosynthesis protein [Yersinia aldovae]
MAKLNFAQVTILSGIVTLLRLVCGFFISKVVAVYTGPSGLAALGQLQNFVTFINGFIASQVSQGVNRYTAENRHDYSAAALFWRAALKLSIAASTVIIIIGVLLSEKLAIWLFHNERFYWLIILALLVIPLNVVNSLFLGVLNGLSDYKRYFIANVLAILSSLVSMSLLVYFYGLTGALISAALNNAIAGFWLVLLLYRQYWFSAKYWFGPTERKKLLEMRNYFFMGLIGAFTGPISLIIVRSILSNHLSITDAGYWQAVSKISEAYLAVLTTALTVYYFPKTAAAKLRSDYLSILKKGALVVIPMAVLMSLTIYFMRDFIIYLLFSKDFYRANVLFFYQNIGDVLRITSWLFATILLAKGYFKTNAILEIVFSALFPLLTYLLINSSGLIAASLAYMLNYGLYLIVVVFVYVAHLGKISNE